MQRALLTSQEAEAKEKQEEFERKIQYRRELQDQMIMNEQMKQNKYEEFLRDKKYMDQVQQRICDEDERLLYFLKYYFYSIEYLDVSQNI